ncbi:MAG: asparagine synthetase B family protein, partial [Ferruginibacter sp.]
ARERVTVALSADAGDETFAGYAKYPLALRFLKHMTRFPHSIRNPASYLLRATPNGLLAAITRNTAVGIKKKRFEQLLQKKELNAADILDTLMSQVYTNEQLAGLLADTVRQPPSYFSLSYLLNDRIGSLNKMLAIDYKTYLVDDILVKVDRAGMSVSLEGREPLLDHRLIEFAARLPESYKLQGSTTKQILKNIVHRYVPKDIMDRPKMGFGVPVFHWLRGELAYYVHEYMKPTDFNKHGLFKQSGVNHIMNRFQAGDRHYNSLFWYLLMFQMWHKRWME